MSVVALIVAAGRGSRAGDGVPKQYRMLAGRPVLARTLEVFASHPSVAVVQTVIHPDDEELFSGNLEFLPALQRLKLVGPVFGGETRQESVFEGLKRLAAQRPDLVLIHDAARPLLTPALIDRAIEAARVTGAALPGVQLTDTVKVIAADGLVVETPDRKTLRAVQTPQ